MGGGVACSRLFCYVLLFREEERERKEERRRKESRKRKKEKKRKEKNGKFLKLENFQKK